ncbi:MAG TPA: tRNA uracil 4-sulfurtransferase ThiI [Candidatus Acidoferrum sp.]|jgi:thiamine biosynthesis protein ThiI
MASAHIVVHYHELWLKRGNRDFFLHKLREALYRALEGVTVTRISHPSDRLIIDLADSAQTDLALERLSRVTGISYLGVARVIDRRTNLDSISDSEPRANRASTANQEFGTDSAGDTASAAQPSHNSDAIPPLRNFESDQFARNSKSELLAKNSDDTQASRNSGDARPSQFSAAAGDPLAPICAAAWEEIRGERFMTFAVRAKRSDKTFPLNALQVEREIGGRLFDQLHAEGRGVRVDLVNPELTCHIEISRGPTLIYARRIPGAGGMPANTAGKLVCMLSGGFDSAVAAFKMMKRGAHLIFVHFWGGGARPGESSVHVARKLLERLAPWQFTAKLYLIPFEPLQREIAAQSAEEFRTLLYRRLMLRIAERIALREKARGVVCGDSLGQVASQTLLNMQAVGAIARLPLYRPLVGDDKLEIQEIARRIGTHDISAEPFHDCCPVFQSKSPALFASPQELDAAESTYDVAALVERGLQSLAVERFRYSNGKVERTNSKAKTSKAKLTV